MNLGYFVLGTVLLVVTVIDILWTTLWIEGGAGPLTGRLMALTWRAVRRVGWVSHRLLTLSGPLILIGSLTLWVGLLWGGWTLVIASAEDALLDTLNRGTVSWFDYVYFAGFVVFTLGTGDFVPREGPWQVVTILATASGLLFITLAVTYVLSVLGAVTQKRTFASGVHGLGSTGPEVVRTSWNGEAFEGLDAPLHHLATQLNTLTSNHKAYPVLHYFHSRGVESAPAIGITVFDEALTLLRFGVTESVRPTPTALRDARAAVENYLGTLHKAFVEPADETPPPPDLTSLRTADIPTVTDGAFAAALADLEERRRLLYGLVKSDARRWPSNDPEPADDQS